MRNNTNITHVVIDIETLGKVASMLKKGTCPISEASFAVVKYDNDLSAWVIGESRKTTFSLGNQNEMDACKETIAWHVSNNSENYSSQLRAALESPLDSADEFRRQLEAINIRVLNEGKEIHYWARGKEFEFTILPAYAIHNNFSYPFMRDNPRHRLHCIRDLEFIADINTSKFVNENPHDSLCDVIQEAKVLCHWLNGGE